MAEININELSIGDWVEIQGVVKRIDYLYGKNNVCDVPIELVHPIPLTPAILEKNGWLPPRKAIKLDTWWWTNGVDKAIEAYEYGGEWYFTIIEQKEIQYRNRVGIGLKYVHQLQHALRLAGVEKEIEV